MASLGVLTAHPIDYNSPFNHQVMMAQQDALSRVRELEESPPIELAHMSAVDVQTATLEKTAYDLYKAAPSGHAHIVQLARRSARAAHCLRKTFSTITRLYLSNRVSEAAVFPFTIPPATLVYLKYLLYLQPIAIIEEHKQRDVVRFKVIQYGPYSVALKSPIGSTNSLGRDEFYLHFHVRGHRNIADPLWCTSYDLAMPLYSLSLRDWLHKHSPLSTTVKKNLCGQLLEGLSHLKLKEVVHCDLKPTNLVMSDDGTLKIIDFGLSSIERGKIADSRGSLRYMPPEAFSNGIASSARDIWSAALIMWEIHTTEKFFNFSDAVPFDLAVKQLKGLTQSAIDVRINSTLLDPDFNQLLKLMLQIDPEKRITADAALLQPYFTEHKAID